MKKSTLKFLVIPAVLVDYALINLFVKRITLKRVNELYTALIDGKIQVTGLDF
jgi:hypothetical protein